MQRQRPRASPCGQGSRAHAHAVEASARTRFPDPEGWVPFRPVLKLRLRAFRHAQPARRHLPLPGGVGRSLSPARSGGSHRGSPRLHRCGAQWPHAFAIARARRANAGPSGFGSRETVARQTGAEPRRRLGGLVPLTDPVACATVPLAGDRTSSYGGRTPWPGGDSLSQAPKMSE